VYLEMVSVLQYVSMALYFCTFYSVMMQ
jgi:hypothetical protein